MPTDAMQIPSRFLDPVTYALMRDPVVGSDGITYDSSTIQKLNVSPVTRRPLKPLVDNVQLRSDLFDNYPFQAKAYRAQKNATELLPPAPGGGPRVRNLKFNNGACYTGPMKGNVAHGHGVYKDNTGVIYVGNFVDARLEGFGELFLDDGAYFSGSFLNNRYHGDGRYVLMNGTQYEGMFCNGMEHGQGRRTYANGNIYDGEFSRGEYCGQGTLTFPGRGKMTAQFKDGSPK